MARSVTVFLNANIAGFLAGMSAAQRAALGLSGSLNGQTKTMGLVSKAAAGIGVAAAVGIGQAVSRFAEFDAQMSAVEAATQATSAEMDVLRDAAIDAGASTVFSATEAAAAQTELAKAGISVSDIMGGALAGSLDLAAAGSLGVADAASIAASTLTQFNLAGADVPHVADLLAAGAGKAQGSVQDLGAALNQVGLLANAMGISVEETTGVLAEFASAGLVGSEAGTAFRSMLVQIASPTTEASTLMKELGLSFYDAQGQFIGMEGVAGQLQDRLSGLSQEQRNAAMSTIFGTYAISAANIMYRDGAEGVADWTNKVNDAGFAAETAATLTDNLKGDVERLGGAFDALLISGGSKLDGALRLTVQTLTGLIDGFNDLDDTQAAEFFTLVGETAGNAWRILVNLWNSLGPVTMGFLELSGSGVATGLMGIASALEAITGFLAENADLTAALAVVVGVQLVRAWVAATVAAHGFLVGKLLFALGAWGAQLGLMLTSLTALRGGFAAAATAAKGLVAAVAPLAAAVGVVYLGAQLLVVDNAADAAREQIDEMWKAVDQADGNAEALTVLASNIDTATAELEEMKQSFADNTDVTGFWDFFDDQGAKIKDAFQDPFSGEYFESQAEAIRLTEEALAEFEAEENRVSNGAKRLGDALGISTDAALQLADAHGVNMRDGLNSTEMWLLKVFGATTETTSAEEAAAVATENLAEGLGDAAENAADMATAIDGLTASARDMIGLSSDFEAAIDDAAEAMKALNEQGLDDVHNAIDEVTGAITDTTPAGREVIDMMTELRDTGVGMFTAIAANGDIDGAINQYNRTRDAIADIGVQAGQTREDAVAMADTLLGTPEEVLTTISLVGGPEVQAAIAGIAADLEGVTALERVAEITANADTVKAVEDLSLVTGIDYNALVTLIANTEAAGGQLAETANPGGAPRTAAMTAVAATEAAEAAFTDVSRFRVQPTTTTPYTTAAEALFNLTARERVQPTETDPSTGTAESAFNTTARHRDQWTTAHAETSSANSALNALEANRYATVYVSTIYKEAAGGYLGDIPGFASGGSVRGPGTGTSDSVPAMLNGRQPIALSNDEFVTNAAVVAEQGVGKFHALNAGQADIVPRYAEGGSVPMRTFNSIGGAQTVSLDMDYGRLAGAIAHEFSEFAREKGGDVYITLNGKALAHEVNRVNDYNKRRSPAKTGGRR